jgi:nicotinate phosphoribosyltransferase
MFHVASEAEIKGGQVTDVYFARTVQVLKEKGITKRVAMEVVAHRLPDDYTWAVLAGVEEVAALFEGQPVDVDSLPEGTFFCPDEPVLVIEGQYDDFAVYETPLLGLLCQASGVATKAARCKKLAGQRSVLSFGARRMHPAISPMIERSVFLGGCDGVAGVKSAELIGQEPVGTMPHALILIMGDTVSATKAFDEVIPRQVTRVSLVDTIGDERFEALKVAQALGKNLSGVRLDTPSSRRGNFLKLLEEVRWELDLKGFRDVEIFVSGGIDEEQIARLNPVANAYGVGTAVSNAEVVDFSLDIIEIEGEPFAKRGKKSGRKQVWHCPSCGARKTTLASQTPEICSCDGQFKGMLRPLLRNGKLVTKLPKVQKIREHVLGQLSEVEF